MKCVIFGGGGFIGSAVIDRLLRDGHEIRVFERPGIRPYRDFTTSERVEWKTGDLLSVSDVTSALKGMDAVFHLVSTTLPKNSNDDPIYDVSTNVIGSLKMLDAMVELGLRKIVFISSGGTVYGKPTTVPIPETHPTDPLTSYGITKLTIEKYLHLYSHLHGISPIILRVANPYGERQRVNSGQGAIGVFLHHALNDRPIEIWGDGSVTRDYIYISDVAEAFACALNYDGPETTFNIGSGKGFSLNEIVQYMEKVLRKPVKVDLRPGRAFDVPSNVLEINQAKSLLRWQPKVNLEQGLARTVEWMREQR